MEAAAADGVTFSVPVTPHTFRHSYAMHMLYAGIPLKVFQSLMGHKSISSTEVYTKVFALDVAARHRVQFSMAEADAVAMLKRGKVRYVKSGLVSCQFSRNARLNYYRITGFRYNCL